MGDDVQGARRRGPNRYAEAAALQAVAHEAAMKIIDMSHVMNVHTPGWVGYAGNKMYYAQNLQTVRIVAQRIDTALHVGTHFDGAMHATDNPKGDMAHLPLDYLCNRGVVVDISKHMHDWAVITPEIIESAGADIRDGDILILHTGNLGGDIEWMLGKRCLIGAFPWRYEGLEACPCRIVCFLDTDMSVEAIGDAAKAILRR